MIISLDDSSHSCCIFELFSSIKETDEIVVKIIGQRFELNDPAISVIAELIDFEKKIKKKRNNQNLLLKQNNYYK